jgi:hypothetical protein
MVSSNGKSALLKSTGHAFFAALFEIFGEVEISLDAKGNFKRLRLRIEDAENTYLRALRKVYGGNVRGNSWIAEGEVAERFAKATYHFAPHESKVLENFVLASVSNKRPLTENEKRRREKLVKAIEGDPLSFKLPSAFYPRRGRIHPHTANFKTRLAEIDA